MDLCWEVVEGLGLRNLEDGSGDRGAVGLNRWCIGDGGFALAATFRGGWVGGDRGRSRSGGG